MLKSKTLAFLEQSGYPSNLIFVFVATQGEFERYQTVLPGYQLVVGLPGLVCQRNFISNWLDEDEIYISLDDDIVGVKGKPFIQIVRDAVALLDTRRAGLFGVLPNDDARCFKDSTTSHLAFIIGAFFICRNHKDIRIIEPRVHDYEMSMLYFKKYGAIFRYRGAGIQTKYLGTCCGTERNMEHKRVIVLNLIRRFPGMCKYRDKKGEPDLLLNWRFKSLQD